MSNSDLRNVVYQCILSLSNDEGIYASGRHEVYGCIFGRDTAITVLKILKSIKNEHAFTHEERAKLYAICRTALVNITALRGKTVNIQSGEEPGKCIHEFRKSNFDRLLKLEKPWYVYPDGFLRNYDSIDATPLTLIALYNFWHQTGDTQFLLSQLPAVEEMLTWTLTWGDKDNDNLLEYELSTERTCGGLSVQSWTDSHESLLSVEGNLPLYPIAPVEVQGYSWLAITLWSRYFETQTETKQKGKQLRQYAQALKKQFNNSFLFTDRSYIFPCQALDGQKNQIQTVTGNPLLLLWASDITSEGKRECILSDTYIPDLVYRSFQSDLFDPEAGIRTMSALSKTFDASEKSYHNGSFWPKLNGMSHEGLQNWGYTTHADHLKQASLHALRFFGTPIELYIKNGTGFREYRNTTGQVSCRQQAWSAASTLDLLTS